MIDLGSETHDAGILNEGISIFQENRVILEEVITKSSVDYCVGNGFNALYHMTIEDTAEYMPSPDSTKELLFQAKQFYYQAYKTLDIENLNEFSIQVLTNLGNNLILSGRIVEALQLYDLVLSYNENFPQAVVAKADGLVFMVQTCKAARTVSLFAEIYRLYDKASKFSISEERVRYSIEVGLLRSKEMLDGYGYNTKDIQQEFNENIKEYQAHPETTKFWLDNFLGLSEHSLYCKCNGAKRDDLTIGFPGMITIEKKIIRLEIILDQLKSEFSQAKGMYYEYKCQNLFENGVHYEVVEESILVGGKYEQLRNSFRLCFGLLDKIASGVCFLYDLPIGKDEKIYFDSFWKSNKTIGRWEKINEIKSIHLTSLYGIAFDLNSANGEFSEYKVWRNKIEHGSFILVSEKTTRLDKYLGNGIPQEIVLIEDFEKRVLHLLQLTRSAIFSFVFATRAHMTNQGSFSRN
jgi:tetratricopeptide (TPR) repeat protein